MTTKAKKKSKVTYLSPWGKVKNWWNGHHTTRKGVETAFFVFVSTVATALLADPTLFENPSTAAMGILIVGLRVIDNWAKHNIGKAKGEKAKKD